MQKRPQRPVSAVDAPLRSRPVNSNGRAASKPRGASAGVTRATSRSPVAASPNPFPNNNNSNNNNNNNNNMQQVSVSEALYLEEQLKDLLKRQAEVDRQHQRELLAFRHTMRSLYDENAVLRNIINAAQRRLRLGGESNPSLPSSVTEAELEHLNIRINLATRKCNRLRFELQGTTGEEDVADAMLASRRSIAVEEREICANRPLFLRIQRLENRLDEVLKKQKTVKVVTQGYEAHYQDLKEESKHYDVRMQTLEKEFSDRHRDHLQLLTLYRNLEEEMKSLLREQFQFEDRFQHERRSKEKALQEKKLSVEAALQDTTVLQRKVVDLEQRYAEELQLLDSAEMVKETLERRLLGDATVELSDEHTAEDEEKLAAFDSAFHTMMAAVRARDVEDLVVVYRREREQLIELQQQVEEKRREVQEGTEALKAFRAETLERQVCGPGDTSTSPVLEEELRRFLEEEKMNFKAARERREVSQKGLQTIVFHINQLAEKLAFYRRDVILKPIQTAEDPDFPLTVAVLAQKTLALADDTVRGGVPQTSPSQTTQVVIPANNVRIRLPSKEGGEGAKVTTISSTAGAGILRHRASSYVSETSDHLPSANAGEVESSPDSDSEAGSGADGEEGASTVDPLKGTLSPSAAKARRNKKKAVTSLPAEYVEEPLTREEVKRMSRAVEIRERKRLLRERQRQSGQ